MSTDYELRKQELQEQLEEKNSDLQHFIAMHKRYVFKDLDVSNNLQDNVDVYIVRSMKIKNGEPIKVVKVNVNVNKSQQKQRYIEHDEDEQNAVRDWRLMLMGMSNAKTLKERSNYAIGCIRLQIKMIDDEIRSIKELVEATRAVESKPRTTVRRL